MSWMGIMILCVLFLCLSRTSQKENAYRKKYHSATATGIKYDKYEFKIYMVLTIVMGIIFAISLVSMSTDSIFRGNRRFDEILLIVVVCGLFMGGALFLLFGYHLLAALFYFKRLERYGYQVPEKKKTYEYVLERLPRSDVSAEREAVQPEYSKTSKSLMWICILVCFVMVCWNFYYLYKWYFMGDDTLIMFGLLLMGDAFWLIPILMFRGEMNTQKFKDDVEIDVTRKVRMNMLSGIVVIAILAGVAMFVKDTAYSMSAYVFNARVSEDGKKIGEIRDVLEVVYIDPFVIANDESLEEIKRSMEAGVDITNWGTPEGEFQEKVAMLLEITDYSQLKEAFRTTDGPAVVYVKLEGEGFMVQLLNLYPAVDREIVSKSLKSN